jgi:hypothetical protein
MKPVDWVVLVLFGALIYACFFLYDKAYNKPIEHFIDSTEIIQHRFDTTIERIKTIHNEKTIYIIAIPDSAIFTHLKIELSKFDTNGWKKNVENYEQP